MTLVIAAAHSTTPKTRNPTSPAAIWKAVAAWFSVPRSAPPATTPRMEEEDDPHDPGDHDPGDRAAGDVADVFPAGDAGVEQPVGAGVDDVAADRAADQRGDRQEGDLLGQDDVAQRLAHRRARGDRDVGGQQDHHQAEDDDDSV